VLRVKVVSLGAERAGKSCLIKRYCEDRFSEKYKGTIGVDYGVKPLRLGGAEVRVNLFDLAGGDAFKTVRMEFYKDAQGLLLVYDAGDRASFEALERWVGEAREGGAAGGAPVVVVGNKAELLAAAVPANEGRAWAEGQGWAFFEASAATGEGVRAAFATLFLQMLEFAPGVPDRVIAAASASVLQEGEVGRARGGWGPTAGAPVGMGGGGRRPSLLKPDARAY